MRVRGLRRRAPALVVIRRHLHFAQECSGWATVIASVALLVVLFRYLLHISDTNCLSMPLCRYLRTSGSHNEEFRQVDVGFGAGIRSSGDRGIEGGHGPGH
jgi:hypothetical protein